MLILAFNGLLGLFLLFVVFVYFRVMLLFNIICVCVFVCFLLLCVSIVLLSVLLMLALIFVGIIWFLYCEGVGFDKSTISLCSPSHTWRY